MKREIRLYNVLLPIWILYFFPQLWIITLPGNLLIDCAVPVSYTHLDVYKRQWHTTTVRSHSSPASLGCQYWLHSQT